MFRAGLVAKYPHYLFKNTLSSFNRPIRLSNAINFIRGQNVLFIADYQASITDQYRESQQTHAKKMPECIIRNP